MFSSLASFIFGSNLSAIKSSDVEKNTELIHTSRVCKQKLDYTEIDSENTFDVTSSTPSVTGVCFSNVERKGKHSKNKRSKNNPKIKEHNNDLLSITKLLISNEDINEDGDDWFIVSKEEEQRPCANSDSEEEIPVIGIKSPSVESPKESQKNGYSHQHRPVANLHSFYSGHRPQQYRNYLHRMRIEGGWTDSGVTTQSLCLLSSLIEDRGEKEKTSTENGFQPLMDESWFVTPPPCFISIGPIKVESSPFEDLLIEHPSMSVYHSIGSPQDPVESYVNLDFEIKESQSCFESVKEICSKSVNRSVPKILKENQSIVKQPTDEGIDRHSYTQMKGDMLTRSNQKNIDKMKCQNLRRGAMKRANKVRDFQSKGNRQRRADMQHCKIISGVNNNRKSCY